MYAVVSTGGKQYRVEPGTTLAIEKLAVEPGATVTFDRVLLVGDGDETTVGAPTVDGATVSGTVLGEERGPKLVIYKFKQKVKYRRHTGHRQHLTRVRIDEIAQDGKSAKVETEARPARRRSPTAKSAPDAPSAAPAAEIAPEAPAKAEARPRRSRATASAKETEGNEAEEEKPAERKRTATRRAAPRKKAESEE
jgi:large subunit ribosomal protein L21